jgi:hypothetical protein
MRFPYRDERKQSQSRKDRVNWLVQSLRRQCFGVGSSGVNRGGSIFHPPDEAIIAVISRLHISKQSLKDIAPQVIPPCYPKVLCICDRIW